MLTQEENKRLTEVSRGTPMGELLRRYWQPVAGLAELEDEPTKAVRLLGEDLVLYRDLDGCLGLLGLHCPHRKASLEYGIPEQNGLRCCYHGWLFDHEGHCLEQPAEPPESTFKDRVRHTAYPVQELGGLVWAYLGPDPAPLLPRYDVFVWRDAIRDIGRAEIACNWLQCMENSVDLTHVDHLHGYYYNYVLQKQGRPSRPAGQRVYGGARHTKIGFEVFDHGIRKKRLLEGGSEDSATWRDGTNPIVFPNMTRGGGAGSMQIRVPIDDYRTRFYLYSCYRPGKGVTVPPQQRPPVYQVPFVQPNGKFATDWITGQDVMVMVTQGPILDRTDEKLGVSDEGIIFYRKVLGEQVDRVQRGEDPLGVIRDPAKNQIIELKPGERATRVGFMDNHWHQFSPIYAEARALILEGLGEPKRSDGDR